jgi:hypothetical protein
LTWNLRAFGSHNLSWAYSFSRLILLSFPYLLSYFDFSSSHHLLLTSSPTSSTLAVSYLLNFIRNFLLYLFHHIRNLLHVYAPSRLLFLFMLLYTSLLPLFASILGAFHLYFLFRPFLPLLSHCLLLRSSFFSIHFPLLSLHFRLSATFLLFPFSLYYFTVFRLLHASLNIAVPELCTLSPESSSTEHRPNTSPFFSPHRFINLLIHLHK